MVETKEYRNFIKAVDDWQITLDEYFITSVAPVERLVRNIKHYKWLSVQRLNAIKSNTELNNAKQVFKQVNKHSVKAIG